MRMIVILAAVLALGACATAGEKMEKSGKAPLAAAQIKQLLDGKTTTGKSSRGYAYTAKYSAKGSVAVKSGKYDETGKWWVKGKDLYCSQYPTIRGGRMGCQKIYDMGGSYQLIRKNGSKGSSFTIQ